jgi:hypothetical protein
VTTEEPQPARTPYRPALQRSARALTVAAAVGEAVELGVGPHREISAVFLGVGLLVGYAVGRSLARQLREWATEATVLDAADACLVRPSSPALLAGAALLVVAAGAIVVPAVWHVPTPLPGALAAGAVQTLLQARVVRDIELQRQGEVVRPVGRVSFDGSELRLRAEPDTAGGQPIMPG